MALLLTPIFGKAEDWRKLFAAEMPELELRIWPDAGNPADIEAAAVALMPNGKLKDFPNLRLIVSLTAGAEGLLARSRASRRADRARRRSRRRRHDERGRAAARAAPPPPPAGLCGGAAAQRMDFAAAAARAERKVGVMGLGSIGLAAAKTLARHGFDVAGWVRTPRAGDGIEIFAGREQLPAFLARSEIVVNFLPLTAETTGILNAAGVRADAEGRRGRQSRARPARRRGRPDGGARQRASSRARRSTCFRSSRCPRRARSGAIPRSPSSRMPRARSSRAISCRASPTRCGGCAPGEPQLALIDRTRGY